MGNRKPVKKRNSTFDFMKCAAIFMVIWQHSIFYSGFGTDMLETSPGKFICMFNMPLFMFIVGYFSESSLTSRFKDMIVKKWHTLLMPMGVYCVIQIIIGLAMEPNEIPRSVIGGG